MRPAFLWDITKRTVVIPYRRFGATYRSRLQASRPSWIRNCTSFLYIRILEHDGNILYKNRGTGVCCEWCSVIPTGVQVDIFKLITFVFHVVPPIFEAEMKRGTAERISISIELQISALLIASFMSRRFILVHPVGVPRLWEFKLNSVKQLSVNLPELRSVLSHKCLSL